MKTYNLLFIGLFTFSLVACSPRITRSPERFNTPTVTTNTQPTPSTPAPSTPTQQTNDTVTLQSAPAMLPTTAPVATMPAAPTTASTYTENPATFTHSNTLPTGTPPQIGDYAGYDDYLAAYYDHYGRDALNPPVPALFSNQAATTQSMASSQTMPSSLPVSPASTTATTAVQPRVIPVGSSEYQAIMQKASEAMSHANTVLAQASQAQSSTAPQTQTVQTQPVNPASTAASGAGFSGAWQGDAIDNAKGIRTTTRLVLEQRDDRLGGKVYFETLSGLEYFGELQGALVGNQSTMTLRYQDGSYTYFTGQFGASFFTGEYQYITSAGQSIASGTLRLSRQ